MSIQETNFQAIAAAIRQKDGTTAPIPANTFAARILAIPTGGASGGFAVPLTVTVDPGAAVTAVNGDISVTGTADDSGTVTLTLTAPGVWTVTGALGDMEKSATVEVVEGYEVKLTLTSRLPEGYTEVEYISNPNLGYIQDAGIPQKVSDCTIDLWADFSETAAAGGIMGNIYDYRQRWGSSSPYRYSCSQMVSYLYWNASKLALNLKQFSYPMSTTQPTASQLNYYSYNLPAGKDNICHIHVDFPQKIYRINEEEISTTEYAATSAEGYPFALFAQNRYYKNWTTTQSITYGQTPCNYKFHSMQVTENATGKVVNDFVPCINPEGLAGLYDLVKEAFYSSTVAAKPFVAGPEV